MAVTAVTYGLMHAAMLGLCEPRVPVHAAVCPVAYLPNMVPMDYLPNKGLMAYYPNMDSIRPMHPVAYLPNMGPMA